MNEKLNLTECDDLQITSHLNVEALPALLQDLLTVAKTTEQKDMLLMSSLTTLSAVMNSVWFRYGTTGKRYYPNLMTFIMAGAASGKGIAELTERLNGAGCTMHDARLDGGIEFRLTAEQARLLGQIMEKEYKEYVRVLGDGFHASVVRNGINVMRIAAVLSVLRQRSASETIDKPLADARGTEQLAQECARNAQGERKVIICTEEDFQTAMVIGTKMLLHAADAYNQIAAADHEAVPSIKGSYQKETFSGEKERKNKSPRLRAAGERERYGRSFVRSYSALRSLTVLLAVCSQGVNSKFFAKRVEHMPQQKTAKDFCREGTGYKSATNRIRCGTKKTKKPRGRLRHRTDSPRLKVLANPRTTQY